MPGAREEVMGRLRAALSDVPPEEAPADVAVTRDYDRGLDSPVDERLDMFAKRVAEYRATVHRVADPTELAAALGTACERHSVRRLVVPAGVPVDWRPAGVEVLDDSALTHDELDAADGVLTGCAAGIALTGTIALQSGPLSGRRAITLLPDLHLCVIEADQVFGTASELFERVPPGRPVTLISGPSATSDIELNRVEGVHGPRRLEVFLLA
jgi:L-lactate dehydrogenase complex protein LldG